MSVIRSTCLYLSNDRHQKQYYVCIETVPNNPDQYVVNFSYGAIGAPQRPGRKTPKPVDLATAQKVYEKLVAEKRSTCSCGCGGSYTTDEDPPTPPAAFAHCAKRDFVSGVTPQNKTVHPVFNPELLDPVDLPAAQRLVRSGQYGAMRKYDGHRIAVSKVAGDVISYNRLGKVIPVPGDVRERLRVLPNTVFLDGEFVAGRYVAFDLLWIDEYDIRELIFEERHSMLLDVLSDTGIAVAPLWVGEDAMMEVIQRERDARGEGIVFKHLRRGYMPGRQGSNLKLKFWVSSTFRIAKKQKTTTHHSFGVEVLKDGYWTYCGSVTCKGPLPEIGTYRECKYLYVGAGGHLYQPEDWGARLDVTDADCTYAQLKIKQDTAQLV